MSDSARSLQSFGVAGVLTEEAEVFYSADLRVRNMGRVSDLIAARLRANEVDELKVRTLLVYGVFQSYAVRGAPYRHREEFPPLALEVGLDLERVALSFSYHWDLERVPQWAELASRIDQGEATDSFEQLLVASRKHCSELVVRYDIANRRVEVVSIFGRVEAEAKPTIVVSVEAAEDPSLSVTAYVELGDLDYSGLLKNPDLVAETVQIKGDQTPEELEATVVSGGTASEDLSEKRFKNGSEKSDEEVQALRSQYEETVGDLRKTVKDLEDQLEKAKNTASERRFTSSKKDEEESVVVKGEAAPATEKKDDWGFHFLKQVWPFSKNDESDSEFEAVAPEPDKEDEAEDVVVISGAPEGEEVDGLEKQVVSESEKAAESALKEIQELAKTKKSKTVEKTLHEIEEEVEPDKAKRWVDSLSKEILQEKAKLSELQKNLTKVMRQRELEFKTAERALKQELKRKDEMISQRQAAIENKNDQIAQLNLAVERASTNTADKESQQMKVKLDRAQKIAQMKEEESKSLVAKMRDLENRLIIAQAKAQKGSDLQSVAKIQNLEKKVEEYKRVNQRLMDSLNSQKDKSSDKEVGDLRRKIEQLDRMNADAKRNLDKASFKLKEAQDSERKLQGDLARAVEENRNLRKQTGRGSGESGGQAA